MAKVKQSGITRKVGHGTRELADQAEASYGDFLKNLDLIALGMESVEAHLKRGEYSAAHADNATPIEKTIETSFSLSELAEDYFDLSASFVLTMRAAGGDTFLRIDLKYQAHFHWKKGKPTSAQVERFAEGEARLIFWPYFRQAVADITARMYIRQITVPLTLSREGS